MPVADSQLHNLIKITKVRKEAITNLGDVLRRRLCLQQLVPACGLTLTHGYVPMLSENQGRELSHFVLIV